METENRTEGWSRKIYLELTPPSLEDNVSDQERILRALREEYGEAGCSLRVLQKFYPLCFHGLLLFCLLSFLIFPICMLCMP